MVVGVLRVARCLRIGSCVHRKTIDRGRLAPVFFVISYLHDTANGLFWSDVFCHDVTGHGTIVGNVDSSLFVCRGHSAPPLLDSKHGIGSVGFRCSCADSFGRSGSRLRLHYKSSHQVPLQVIRRPSRCSRHISSQRKD